MPTWSMAVKRCRTSLSSGVMGSCCTTPGPGARGCDRRHSRRPQALLRLPQGRGPVVAAEHGCRVDVAHEAERAGARAAVVADVEVVPARHAVVDVHRRGHGGADLATV